MIILNFYFEVPDMHRDRVVRLVEAVKRGGEAALAAFIHVLRDPDSRSAHIANVIV